MPILLLLWLQAIFISVRSTPFSRLARRPRAQRSAALRLLVAGCFNGCHPLTPPMKHLRTLQDINKLMYLTHRTATKTQLFSLIFATIMIDRQTDRHSKVCRLPSFFFPAIPQPPREANSRMSTHSVELDSHLHLPAAKSMFPQPVNGVQPQYPNAKSTCPA